MKREAKQAYLMTTPLCM